jgi:hypothetical protein
LWEKGVSTARAGDSKKWPDRNPKYNPNRGCLGPVSGIDPESGPNRFGFLRRIPTLFSAFFLHISCIANTLQIRQEGYF